MIHALITAKCGSHLFGLDTENSDKDYLSLVIPVENEQMEMIKDGKDYFFHDISWFCDIKACASPLIVPSYDAVVSHSDKELFKFWRENSAQLADIFPNATYLTAINEIERFLEEEQTRAYKVCVRLMGLIWGRYHTGNMLAARNLTELWQKRYFEAKDGTVSKVELLQWLQACKTRSIQDYFDTQGANFTLHKHYRKVIDDILEGNHMIEYILPAIIDSEDYISALAVFKTGAGLEAEEVRKLLSLYTKYSDQVNDPEAAKLCLALDLLPGRTREDAADFAALELPKDDLEALFLMRELMTGRKELTGEIADTIVAVVTEGVLTRPVDILLARAALDAISGSRDFSGLREQAAALAAFLTGLGPEVVDRYSVLLGEVRMKCRR